MPQKGDSDIFVILLIILEILLVILKILSNIIKISLIHFYCLLNQFYHLHTAISDYLGRGHDGKICV
jgi:hypothetical protein